MNIQYIHPADQIVMFMQRIYDKRLTTMSGGNLSIRDSEETFGSLLPALTRVHSAEKTSSVSVRTESAKDSISYRPNCRSIGRFIICARI